MATINIRNVKLHNPEPLIPATDGYGGERANSATTTANVDTTIKNPVYVQVLEAPVPVYLNDEAFRVVVAQPMDETPS